jgi:hypothetical protein
MDTQIATITSVFDPLEGQEAFDYVFDMTGETRHDRPDEVCIFSCVTSLAQMITKF